MFGCGTVFKITPAGTLTTLYIFNGANGAQPMTALVKATDGNVVRNNRIWRRRRPGHYL